MLLSRVFQKANGMRAFEYAKENLFNPLNITNVRWEKDRDVYTSTAWGLHTTVRDYAKFGYLFLNKGRWEDKQIMSEEWVGKSTKTDPTVKMWAGYGYLWHVNLPYRLKWSKSVDESKCFYSPLLSSKSKTTRFLPFYITSWIQRHFLSLDDTICSPPITEGAKAELNRLSARAAA